MTLRLLPSPAAAVDLEPVLAPVMARLAAVAEAADEADAKAVNARGMVLNDRPKLAAVQAETATLAQQQAALEALANQLGQAIPASEVTHAAFDSRIAALEARPVAKDGKDGERGLTGPAGTANLAVAARPIGLLALGGSTTLTMPLSRTMPSADYRVEFAHSAVVALANVTYSNVVKTTTSVTVKVTSVGLALAAGTVVAVAV